MEEAVLDTGMSRGQIALGYFNPQSGLAIDAVAHYCPRPDHRLERRKSNALRLGIGVADEDIAPNPALFQITGDSLVIKTGFTHRFSIARHAVASHRHRLHIHQEWTSLACQFEQRCLARSGPDQQWVGLRIRPWPQHRHLEVPVPAFVLEVLLGPGFDKDLLDFLQTRLGFMMVHAEALIIVNIVGGATAETNDQAPLGNVVEDRQLFGKADRMVQRSLHNCEANFAVTRRGRQCAGKADRVDIGADPVKMMLGEPDYIDTKRVGEPRLS